MSWTQNFQFTKNTDFQHFHHFNVKVSKKQSSPKLTQCTLPLTFSQHSALSVLKWDHRHGALNTLGQISSSLLISKPPNSKNAIRLTSIPFGILLQVFTNLDSSLHLKGFNQTVCCFVVASHIERSRLLPFLHKKTCQPNHQKSEEEYRNSITHFLIHVFCDVFSFSENAPHG